MTLGEKILATEPTLIGAADGSWLAVAGEGAIVRVGVMGQTQEAARVRFKEALTRFAAAVEGAGGKST